jgi:hypothetical protein
VGDPAGTFRRGFTRITQRSAIAAAQEDYDRVTTAMARSMHNAARRGEFATPLDVRHMMSAARNTAGRHTQRMVDHLIESQLAAQRDSLQVLARFVARREGGSALDERAVFQRVLDQRRIQMQAAAEDVMVGVMGEINAKVARILGDAVRAERVNRSQLVGMVEQAYESEFWRVERAVRTQASFAFNASVTDGIHVIGREFPDMRIRWVELVSDQTGEPLDNRVANDSLALHGQLKTRDGVFIMPRDRRVDSKLYGKTYDAPPNRPNDRAVLMPWRKAWGIPGWVYRDGTRRWVVRRAG